MAEFIARKIREAKDAGGLEAGQAKYLTYFGTALRLILYGPYKPGVDDILIHTIGPNGETYEDCIINI